jgi:S-disulfanyl-L-cysteine oxidoreductase SoxD
MKKLTVLALASIAMAAAAVVQSRRLAFATTVRAAEPTRTVWDSVYADSQAVRGDSLYAATCVKCHGAELKGGDDGTPLTGDEFFLKWNGKTLDELSELVRTTMPSENPKSLSRPQVTQLVAYLLARNHFPAGQKLLPTDRDSLADIKLVQTKP